jgi:hypothetical protein
LSQKWHWKESNKVKGLQQVSSDLTAAKIQVAKALPHGSVLSPKNTILESDTKSMPQSTVTK